MTEAGTPHGEETTVETTAAAGSVPVARRALDERALIRRTHQMLQARVPLTLLLDLADQAGPRSHDHYVAEGGDASWAR